MFYRESYHNRQAPRSIGTAVVVKVSWASPRLLVKGFIAISLCLIR